MKKLLFLDFDGVLHPTTTSLDRPPFCHAPLLESALQGRDCDVVVSSSWRHHHTHQEILAHLPSALRQKVVGFTGQAHIGRWPRFTEIQNYMVHLGIANWRALDDSFLEFPENCSELIRCNPNEGLTSSQVQAVVHWLETKQIP